MIIAVINGLMLLFGGISIISGIIGLILDIKDHELKDVFSLIFYTTWFLFNVSHLIGFFIEWGV